MLSPPDQREHGSARHHEFPGLPPAMRNTQECYPFSKLPAYADFLFHCSPNPYPKESAK